MSPATIAPSTRVSRFAPSTRVSRFAPLLVRAITVASHSTSA